MISPVPATDAERRSRLLATKLSALVGDHLGRRTAGEAVPFARGAGLVEGTTAWVLLDAEPSRGLGPAMMWADQLGAEALNVLAETATGLLARRAFEFAAAPTIWRIDGRTLVPAEAEAPVVSSPAPAAHAALRPLIEAGGAEPVVEHGVLAGEVEGLEVCRVVTDPLSGAARLEVGTGAADRELFQLLHGEMSPVEALSEVVATVAAHRRGDARPHPLNRLGAERRFRRRLVDDPAVVGAEWLVVAPPPVPRENLRDPTPCVALGAAADERLLVVVCSVGVDPDLVPFAADARSALAPEADLVLALRARDVVAPTAKLAGALRRPARIVAIG